MNVSGAGALQFSANLHVNDLTSGFETEDNFSATLILNEDTANPVLTFSAHDTNGDGVMREAELCPKLPVNGVQARATVTCGTPGSGGPDGTPSDA
jgi:hypothetical protein